MYTPPAGNAANFELSSYTPPAGNAANFEMNPTSSNTSAFFLLFNMVILVFLPLTIECFSNYSRR